MTSKPEQIRQRVKRGEPIAGEDLHGLSFAGLDLAGGMFNELNLNGVNFSDCDLRDSVFSDCQLEHAQFTRADLKQTAFNQCAMSASRFSESHIELTMFNDCRLEQSDFSRLSLNQSHWMSCQLAGANFSATQHDRTTFYESPLDGAMLNQARLCLVTFFRLNLCKTQFEGVNFDRVTFFECDHRGKSYAGQSLIACQFTDNQLDDVDFSQACGAMAVQADMEVPGQGGQRHRAQAREQVGLGLPHGAAQGLVHGLGDQAFGPVFPEAQRDQAGRTQGLVHIAQRGAVQFARKHPATAVALGGGDKARLAQARHQPAQHDRVGLQRGGQHVGGGRSFAFGHVQQHMEDIRELAVLFHATLFVA
jgi:uncharacterized protein YjbI with pentapeptide repeats